MSQDRSALELELIAQIKSDGPIPIDRYMSLCLMHPKYGYYIGGDPLGRSGDFTTAPEISQIFGELIGIWCVSGWQIMDAPDPVHLIELGPGRGTMMADMLRAADVMPGFSESIRVHLVETSPALRKIQAQTLAKTTEKVSIAWHEHLEDVPSGPSLLVANEFFDALPIQQLERRDDRWFERVVGLSEGELTMGLAAAPIPPGLMPEWAWGFDEGSIVELSPARDRYASGIARRLQGHKGAALIIDYGHIHSGKGDTLQAVRKHRFADVLNRPGEHDLTSHVDFEQLGKALNSPDVVVHGPLTQSQFLFGMGLGERANVLKKRAGARARIKIGQATERLVAAKQMGHLFKVMAASGGNIGTPAPFGQPIQEGKT